MRFFRYFFALEASAALVLLMASCAALVLANSPFNTTYEALLHWPVTLGAGDWRLEKTLHHWINDGLMAIFFLLVGLEIKRELLVGELSSRSLAMLPLLAAAGGVIVPALIYLSFNHGTPAMRGWAVPCATDIAFSLGILGLLGKRVPLALKAFLMAVAVIDDLIAVVIIALFYTLDISASALSLALLALAGLVGLNLLKVRILFPYMLLGVFLWLCVLQSGVHATIAGVLLGLCLPIRVKDRRQQPLATALEHKLHPWVAYGVMPIFAFANAGIPLEGLRMQDMEHPVFLGIALGLCFGKQFGILIFSWLAVRLRLAQLPEGVGYAHLYGVGLIAGIGFTMSLFIGALAFPAPELENLVRLGVMLGSLVSAIAGYLYLMLRLR